MRQLTSNGRAFALVNLLLILTLPGAVFANYPSLRPIDLVSLAVFLMVMALTHLVWLPRILRR